MPYLTQLLFLLLFESCLFCGLWQVVDVRVTLAVMAMAPILALLADLPRNWYPPLLRQMMAFTIVGVSFWWLQLRIAEATQPLDLVVVETGAVMALGLLTGGNYHEYTRLAFLSAVLLGYGGLHPVRDVFIPAFLAAIALIILLLYQTRTRALMPIGEQRPPPSPAPTINWRATLTHLGLVLAAVGYFITYFPINRELRSRGLIPVSFNARQTLSTPELFQNWFRPAKSLLGKTDGEESPSPQNPTQSATAKHLMDTPGEALDSRDGGMGNAMGRDLVFRVASPAKLYWTVQLYDTYDGMNWTRSNSLIKGRNLLDTYQPETAQEVVQDFAIVKPISRWLPFAYRGIQLRFEDSSDIMTLPIITRMDGNCFCMRNVQPIPLPWRYRIQSLVPVADLKAIPKEHGQRRRLYGWNYRALPEKIISDRLRILADEITANAETELERANAIRDWLHNNCQYTLSPPSIPQDAETVDYFLCESRKGYCQHYAQAMVVLARLNGLHARLATGFSPGQYNPLLNCFEVYEYHAHAWAQIFIMPWGWLTFDGAPAVNFNPNHLQTLLSSMMDPFGEKWGSRPPELDYHPPRPRIIQRDAAVEAEWKARMEARKRAERRAEARQTQNIVALPPPIKKQKTIAEEAKSLAAQNSITANPDPPELVKAYAQVAMDRALLKSRAWLRGLADRARLRWRQFGARIRQWGAWLLSLGWPVHAALATMLAAAVLLWEMRRKLTRLVRLKWRLWRCERLWRRICQEPMSPRQRIDFCRILANRWFALAAFQRPPVTDMEERQTLLPLDARELSPDYLTIAHAAFDCWYGREEPSAATERAVRAATARIREQIPPFIQKAENRYGGI
ncbi:MAG: transglutaminase domain-containing protein [Victivallales bacterium]|nr:transglutaminase domain-containing protein [Victivallales bacterium]